MKTVVVTGTTASKSVWTPFGDHVIPGIPVTVTLSCDDNGIPVSVTDVVVTAQAAPIS